MALPNPFGALPIPGVDLPDIPNPLDRIPNPLDYIPNPFEWLLDQIRGLFDDLSELIQRLIINPPRPVPGEWQDYIYGNGLGLARELSVAVAIILVILAMLFSGLIKRAGQAVLIAVFIAAAGPLFYAFTDAVVAAGVQLADAMKGLHTPSSQGGNGFFSLPDITNALGAIIGLGTSTFFGAFLVFIFIVYGIIVVGVVFWALIILALYPLGSFAERIADWLLSIGIVALFAGQAAAIFWLEMGQVATDNMLAGLGSNPFVAASLLNGAILLAIASQVFLIWGTQKAIVKAKGFLNTHIRGRVETYSNQRRQQDALAFDRASTSSITPIVVRRVGDEPPPGTVRAVLESGLVVVASRANPAVGAAAAATKTATKKSST